MKRLRTHVPNVITIASLLSGCLGIVLTFEDVDKAQFGSYFILLSAFLDFLDGAVARILRVSSLLGKQLDSLSDMVCFGILPGMIMFKLLNNINDTILPYVAFALIIAAAVRLGKFNIDERQTSAFLGLPTPSAALFIAGLPFFVNYEWLNHVLSSSILLVVITVFLSFMMVSELKIFSFKFSPTSRHDNWYRFSVIIFALISLIWIKLAALPFIIAFYLLVSVINSLKSASRSG